VKLTETAEAKSRQLPFGGALNFHSGDTKEDDPLRCGRICDYLDTRNRKMRHVSIELEYTLDEYVFRLSRAGRPINPF
jgi:hypothetical protein